MGMTCQNLLLSVLWPAICLQWPFHYSISVFYSHTHPLDLMITPICSISQITNSSSSTKLVFAATYTTTTPSPSSNTLVHWPLSCLPGHQISPFSLSSNLAQSPIISKTLLFLSCPLLFCSKGKTSFLNDCNYVHRWPSAVETSQHGRLLPL